MPQFECPACHARGDAPAQVGAIACPRCGGTVPLAATGVTTPEIAEAQQARKRAEKRLPVAPTPTAPESSSGSWVFIIGLVCGAALLLFMAWDGFKPSGDHRGHSDHIVMLTDENWQTEVLDSDVPVLVDFYADWCGPCKALAPTIDRLADRFHGKVKVAKLNVDLATKTSARYEITGIPALLLFKNGKSQRLNVRSETELANILDHVSQ